MRKIKITFIIIFLIIITFPSMGVVLFTPDVSIENRAVTAWPEKLEEESIQQYEGFFIDRIAFRKDIIKASAFIDYFIFKKSISENVMIGRNDQLYYVGGDIKKDMTREVTITSDMLDAIVQVQNEIQQEMDSRGIKYIIVIPPDKHNVYTEDVPDYYKRYWDTKPSIKEQVLKELKEKSNVEILDLTQALVNENKLRPTYLSTDSHWNYNGSFVGYQEIVKKIREWFPDIPMYERDDFNIQKRNVNNQNLSKMLSLGDILYDQSSVSYTPEQPGDMIEIVPNYPDPNWGSPEFKMIVTEQREKMGLPKAVMYRDSFAGLDGWSIGNLNRFLNTSFDRFASYTTHQVDFNYIDTEQADVVIFELLESNIIRLGINYLNNGEASSDKPLYRFNTPLNGDWYEG